jgi:hypothetical protein
VEVNSCVGSDHDRGSPAGIQALSGKVGPDGPSCQPASARETAKKSVNRRAFLFPTAAAALGWRSVSGAATKPLAPLTHPRRSTQAAQLLHGSMSFEGRARAEDGMQEEGCNSFACQLLLGYPGCHRLPANSNSG